MQSFLDGCRQRRRRRTKVKVIAVVIKQRAIRVIGCFDSGGKMRSGFVINEKPPTLIIGQICHLPFGRRFKISYRHHLRSSHRLTAIPRTGSIFPASIRYKQSAEPHYV